MKAGVIMDSSKIGKFIAELRKEKNVTQQQLADTLYVTRESVSKWERGVNTPEVPSLVIMSKFFNVSVNELIAGERLTKDNKEKIENVALNSFYANRDDYSKYRLEASTIDRYISTANNSIIIVGISLSTGIQFDNICDFIKDKLNSNPTFTRPGRRFVLCPFSEEKGIFVSSSISLSRFLSISGIYFRFSLAISSTFGSMSEA